LFPRIDLQNTRVWEKYIFEPHNDLSDEAEQGIRIIQIAEADNTDRGLNNSDILRKPNSIIISLFIQFFQFSLLKPKQNEQKQQKPSSKQNNFTKFPAIFQFMQNTAAKIRGHLQIRIYLSCSHADTRYTAILNKVVLEQSGKVQYERERMLGITMKIH
jgi:hypothetical protein